MTVFFIPIIVVFGGTMLLVWFLVLRPLNRERTLRKSPFTRDLVRGPGEGCLEKMADLTDQLDTYLILAIFPPFILAGYLMGLHQPPPPSRFDSWIVEAALLATAFGASVYGMLKIRTIIQERSDYRLGFLGERHTAQAISPLSGDGYKIYHDLQCRKAGTSETFNIDHVLLGPAGVIAIETKTRSKPIRFKGRAEVTFDGNALDFGTHRDVHGIQQALANANNLASLISKRTGTRIAVIPILCLPGWWVNARTLEPLFVGNSDQVPSRVRSLPPCPMDAKIKNQISTLLGELSAAKVD